MSPFGTPALTINEAISRLQIPSLLILKTSHYYESPAFPAGSGPNFVNAVVAMQSEMRATDLLAHLHRIEEEMGRERHKRWAARTIDLDLIAYGQNVLPDHATFDLWRGLDLEAQMARAPDGLVLPHPRMQDRAFVLRPLCDVAPDWQHPVLGRSAAQLLAACPQADNDALIRLSELE